MQLVKKGLFTVASNAVAQPLSPTSVKVCKVGITPTPGQSGKIYVGDSTLNIFDLTTVAREIWPDPSGGIPDRWELVSPDGKNSIDLHQIYVAVFTSGEGPIVEAWRL